MCPYASAFEIFVICGNRISRVRLKVGKVTKIMAKTLKERLQGYAFDLREDFDRAKNGDHSWGEALRAAWLDTRKLAYRVSKGETTNNRKHAIDLVKRGMAKYNEKHYAEAEELFRRAAAADGGYARAHAYLGNAIYKQRRLTDAITCWNKAVEVEPNSDAADLAREKLLSVAKKNDVGPSLADGFVQTRG